MPDRYGAFEFPGDGAETPAGDKALRVIGEFLKAVLDANLSGLWGSVSSGCQPIASRVEFHDPAEDFSAKHLPAIYIWCSAIEPFDAVTTDDEEARIRVLTWEWFFEPAARAKQNWRSAILSPIDAAVRIAIRKGRDPAYFIAGDTDTTAETLGSVVQRHAGVSNMRCLGTKFDMLSLDTGAGSKEFNVISGSIEMREYFSPNVEFYPASLQQDYLLEDQSLYMRDIFLPDS